jgi:hypothetical protein
MLLLTVWINHENKNSIKSEGKQAEGAADT